MSFSDFTPVYLDFIAAPTRSRRARPMPSSSADPNKVMTDLAQRTNVRLLPYAASDLDRLMQAVSYYRPVVMRKGALRGLDADVAQPAVVNILATHARMSETTVAEVVAAIVTNAAELGRLNALFEGLSSLFEPLRRDGPKALELVAFALHPGRCAPTGTRDCWRAPERVDFADRPIGGSHGLHARQLLRRRSRDPQGQAARSGAAAGRRRLTSLLVNPQFVAATFNDEMPAGKRVLFHDSELDFM